MQPNVTLRKMSTKHTLSDKCAILRVTYKIDIKNVHCTLYRLLTIVINIGRKIEPTQHFHT